VSRARFKRTYTEHTLGKFAAPGRNVIVLKLNFREISQIAAQYPEVHVSNRLFSELS
jgi:hypothetical protein